MFFIRKIYPLLIEHSNSELVTVLTGIRRSGKTTLVKQLLLDIKNKNSLFFDLQRADNRELFDQKNYDSIREAFLARGLTPDRTMIIALDEIQLSKEIPGVIKYLSDHYKIKFIVTGSSSYYLKNLFSESLAGRKKIFELYPLDFGEFLNFKQIPYTSEDWLSNNVNVSEYNRLSNYYEEFVKFGGFPQVVMAQSEAEKHDLLLDIMSAYINIDIRSLADFSDERNLYALAKLLASRVGNRIDYSKLASLVGLSRPTVTNYISFLEKTYLINTIGVHTHNTDREIVKARKLYFCDTGLANILADISSGSQFENTVFNQLARQFNMQYYALKNGQEIDFVLDGKIGVETKETPVSSDVNSLTSLASTAKLRNIKLVGRRLSPKFDRYAWAGSIV